MGSSKLDYIDFRPHKKTLYFKIATGKEAPANPKTAVFLTEQASLTDDIDVLLWLHGHKDPKLEIDDYLMLPHFPLRQRLNGSQKGIVLIAPTMGPNSEPGRLEKNGDDFLDEVFAELGEEEMGGSTPKLGSLVLACHSGGGVAMLKLAQTLKRRVNACWGYDCLYNTGVATEWATWAKFHPTARMVVYYLGSTADNSQELERKRLPNVVVRPSKAPEHNDVPKFQLGDDLRRAWDLFGPNMP